MPKTDAKPVKLKNRKIMEYNAGLQQLANNETISMTTQFHVGKLKVEIEKLINIFTDLHKKLLTKNQEENPDFDHKKVEAPDNIRTLWKKGGLENYNKEYENLMEIENEVTLTRFTLKDFEPIENEDGKKMKSTITSRFFTLMADLITE